MVGAKRWSSLNLDWMHYRRSFGGRAESNLICQKIQGNIGRWTAIFVRAVYCTEASASFARAQAQVSSARDQGAVDVTPEEAGRRHNSVAGGAGSSSSGWEGDPGNNIKKGPNNNI